MRIALTIAFSFMILWISGCKQHNWTDLELKWLSGENVNMNDLSAHQTVFIFLSPECPLCQNYTVKINQLIERHQSDSLLFAGVVSGTFYPSEEIKRYLIKYRMKLPVLLDPDFKLAGALGAEITPEVFFTAQGGKIIYQGAIDDWAISLGQKKLRVENDYLEAAIMAFQQNKVISPAKTKAVGCFIE
jgi:hypothetical protein